MVKKVLQFMEVARKLLVDNSIIDNTCKNNRFNQIEVWQSDNNIVSNNTVEESIDGIGNLGAICLFATTGTTVTGNKVLSAQNNGIRYNCWKLKLHNNR